MNLLRLSEEHYAALQRMQSLSEQERRVAEALAKEAAPKTIAGMLGIAERTVGVYIERTRRKLGVQSVVGIALVVQRAQSL